MSASNIHSKYINSVNNLSLRNLGLTGKNPSVACLIIDYSKSISGEVLSYGLTSINGSPHAEINALKKVNKKQITNQTFMYVSLEPCFKLEKCCAKKIANSGIRVIIAGLDMDYLGNPFGPMPNLMAVSEYVTKVHAVCKKSGNIANYSYRKNKKKDIVVIGEKDKYEPLSRSVFYKKMNKNK